MSLSEAPVKSSGYIEALLVKAERKAPMISAKEGALHLEAGKGIAGDRNAHPLSPRHVLLAAAEVLTKHNVAYGSLRENIVTRNLDLSTLTSGGQLTIGKGVKIRITFPCEPCSYLTKLQVAHPQELMKERGILGIIVTSGVIRIGDSITYTGNVFQHVPARLYDRFLWVLTQMPRGVVLDYKTLITFIGGSSSYLRALPGFIKKAESMHLPVHRIVDSSGQLIPYVRDQEILLLQEGIPIENRRVSLENYLWNCSSLYYQHI